MIIGAGQSYDAYDTVIRLIGLSQILLASMILA